MRIAIVETAPFGGLLHYAVQLGDGLADRGHSVDLITPRGHELAGHDSAANMRAILTPSVRTRDFAPTGRLASVARRAAVAVRLTRSWLRIVWEVRRGRYDVVLQTGAIDVSVAAAGVVLLTWLPGMPPVAQVCHNARIFNRGRGGRQFGGNRTLIALLRTAFRRFDLVFMHGERSREEFESAWVEAEITLIPHGDERLFADRPPPPAPSERVLFFGVWNRIKGLPVLMDAFDRLAVRRPEATLTIAGAPSPQEVDVDAVMRWADSHGDRVEVIDHYVPLEEVPALFGRARVVAAPYTLGYQSGVIHLAMTMARAVVASDVGDFRQAVADGETGILVPPSDPEALSAALERVLEDPERATEMGAAGRSRVMSNSSWEAVAAEVESALAKLPG